jgi:site-specific DNA-cytosine methylase
VLPKANPNNKLNIVIDYDNDIYRRIHPIEAERCQTVPDNYTLVQGVSETKRLEMLGNGWTVDVIAHIFKNLK